jgi:hypothetical protein
LGAPNPLEALIDRYCEAWSIPDAALRKRMLDEVWAEGAVYTDPRAHTTGAQELCDHIGRILQSRPGARIQRTSAVDAHHNLARFHWHVVLPDGTTLPEGIDVAELSDDGKIRRIVGFFGPLARR